MFFVNQTQNYSHTTLFIRNFIENLIRSSHSRFGMERGMAWNGGRFSVSYHPETENRPPFHPEEPSPVSLEQGF